LHASHTNAQIKDACNASLRWNDIFAKLYAKKTLQKPFKEFVVYKGKKHAIKNISKIKELQIVLQIPNKTRTTIKDNYTVA
jgi:hypothetical protein